MCKSILPKARRLVLSTLVDESRPVFEKMVAGAGGMAEAAVSAL